MSECWFKFSANMYDDIKMKILCNGEDGDTANYIWIRSMCLARKTNDQGYFYINKNIPYTVDILAIEFARPIEAVKKALNKMIELQMIEIDENGFYKIVNWNKHQNTSALEKNKERVARYRAKKKLESEEQNKNENTEDSDEVPNVEEENITSNDSNITCNDDTII